MQKEQPGSSADTKKKESSVPAPQPKSSVPLRIAGKTTPKPTAPHPAENMFVEDLTSVPEQAHWNCVRKGKIHVLEIFAGCARFSQCCALTGLKVGTPVDTRTGFDVMTSKGRHMVMEIIREQAPDVILMAPVCGPWSNMQNIQQDQQRVWEKRKRYLRMVEFVATWGDFNFCAYGLKDPESGLRNLKPTSLMHCLPPEVMRPIFRRCKNSTRNAGTFGSRTKLAQVYPHQFCQDLAHILLRHLKVKPLDNEVYLLEDLFEPFTIKQVDILRKEMEARSST